MSVFEMTKCDNPLCKNTAAPDKLDGWISIEMETSGYCEDTNDVQRQIVKHGKNATVYTLPDAADFCCLECFLKATGLKG